MDEKKSRVSRYKKFDVTEAEFKKQEVVNPEKVTRLNKMAQSIQVVHLVDEELTHSHQNAMVDTEITSNQGSKDMQTIESFAKHVQNHQDKTMFLVDEEEVVSETDEKVEPIVVEEVTSEEVCEATEMVEEQDPSENKKAKRNKRWYFFGIGFFTFCNICALICFFVAYGPFNYVRDLFVTTAMRTMTHKYFANVLYSTETIQQILASNVTIEPDEVMDTSAIKIGNIQESQVYSSIYEEQVLKRDEGNDLYKVIRLDENGYEGYVTFIYDPTKIQLGVTSHLGNAGEYVSKIAKRHKAVVAINGGGFIDRGAGGQPSGYVIQNGKVTWSRKRGNAWAGGTVGFSKDGVMILTKKRGKEAIKQGVYNAVDFGPFLIVNGKSAEVSGNGGWGIHPRTVIGQRKDGIVVFLTIDGRSASSIGVDLNVAIEIMERYEVYNAANMDGGASTTLVIDGKVKNKPVGWSSTRERQVPTAWMVVAEE